MKKVFSLILVTWTAMFFSPKTSAQAFLHIVRLDSFPELPSDTAFEGIDYHHIRIVVTNTGSSSFFGDIKVFLYSQNIGISGVDTLRDDPTHWVFLSPGDTNSIPAVTLPPPNYEFRSIHYAAGDNIIVVWPYSGTVNFDNYQANVYFVPQSVGINELNQTAFNVYPTPVSGNIHLNYGKENQVEQVRIYDPVGNEIFRTHDAVKTINVSGFDAGLYFLELIQKDGSHAVKKILVTGN